jgi:hypothetical protein
MKNWSSSVLAVIVVAALMSCGNNNSQEKTITGEKKAVSDTGTGKVADNKTTTTGVEDGPAIATIETSDYVLKVHRAIPFTLKPKSYQPFKMDPNTKLVALDISVRNKLSTPLDFSRILIMSSIKGKGEKNLVAPWVVAAYEVDYPENGHQAQYNALWSTSFEPNGFHRAILMGINPPQDENKFTLSVPEKADFNNPARKTVEFAVE